MVLFFTYALFREGLSAIKNNNNNNIVLKYNPKFWN